jgi:predicted nucleic acid-binding protein
MVAIDSTMLSLLLNPGAAAPDPNARAKVEHLIAEMERAGTRIAIPTPVLSEVLIRRGVEQSQAIVATINQHAVFSIEPFDARAAIEMAELMRKETAAERKAAQKGGAVTYAKLKFDRQIFSIAKVVGASRLYTDDKGLRTLCTRVGGVVPVGLHELPLPPERQQHSMFGEEESG